MMISLKILYGCNIMSRVHQKQILVTEKMYISVFSVCFWRYLTVLIWHLRQFSKQPSLFLVRLWNHARVCSWNQPVLSNRGTVSCSMKQRVPLMGREPTISTLPVRRITHCATPPPQHLALVYHCITQRVSGQCELDITCLTNVSNWM